MRMEPELWDALLEICQRERRDMSQLVPRSRRSGTAVGAPARSGSSCWNISASPQPRRATKPQDMVCSSAPISVAIRDGLPSWTLLRYQHALQPEAGPV